MRFSKLQSRHELLLDLQSQNKPIAEEVKSYINDARNEAKNYSPEERDHLRANLRFWAAYIFEQTENYPDTELTPISEPNTISLLIQNSGKILYATIIVALLFLGFVQITKIINVIQSPNPTNPPQVIIYDKGGTFFIVIFGIFSIIIIFLQIIIFRRQPKLFFSQVGKSVSNVVGAVRRTIVGGGRRGKPLATLRIIEGSPAMIGQELKIFSESIKLGRDPQKADMTFFTPEANTSISGLHARIEKVNGTWRIVAVSSSGSETFVDDTAIPFNEPYPLNDGRIIRLGYLAQQPVVFRFTSEVVEKTIPSNVIKISADKRTPLKQPKDDSDNIFDEFRERE